MPRENGGIRPEYAALAAEFERLAAPFGDRVDDRLRTDITRLAGAIERIDRVVDDARDDETRRSFWTFVVERMAGRMGASVPDDLRDGVDVLRAIGDERGVLARLRRIVAKEAKTSEAMRKARSGNTFVPLVLREGRLTAALALVVAGAACSPRFRRFFFRLGGPANLVDKIKDAKHDHARGEMLLLPSPRLYFRLVASLLTRSVARALAPPRPLAIVTLGFRDVAYRPNGMAPQTRAPSPRSLAI
jgi:hypothetical protein